MVPRTFVPVCNCRRGFFALQCHKSLSPLQTGLQKGRGLDGTPLHEHEETKVSRVRMQAGIEKARSATIPKRKKKRKSRGAGIEEARSADDSEKEKEKKKAEVQESKKREARRFRKGKRKEKAEAQESKKRGALTIP